MKPAPIVISVLTAFVVVLIVMWMSPLPVYALNPNHSCDICHSLHNAPGQNLTNYEVVEDLCLSCHGPAGTATQAHGHTNKNNSRYPAFYMTCLDCHNPHDNRQNYLGGTNLMMVGDNLDSTGYAKIATPNSGIRDVVFESFGSNSSGTSLHSFADNDEDNNGIWDGVCEVCHTQVTNHRNNSSGSHMHFTGTDCTACHRHNIGFLATGGGCATCH